MGRHFRNTSAVVLLTGMIVGLGVSCRVSVAADPVFRVAVDGYPNPPATRSEGVSEAQGLLGKALDFGETSVVEYADDCLRSVHSLEFWFRPNWGGDDGRRHEILALGGSNGLRIAKEADNRLHLHLGESDQSIDARTELRWHDWRKLHALWDESTFGLVIDCQTMFVRRHDSPLKDWKPSLQLGGVGPLCQIDKLKFNVNPPTFEDVVRDVQIERSRLGSSRVLSERMAINGHPARMMIDTGASCWLISDSFVDHYRIPRKTLPEPVLGIHEYISAQCDIGQSESAGQRFSGPMLVMKVPSGEKLAIDGFIGWNSFQDKWWNISWKERGVRFLSQAPFPQGSSYEIDKSWNVCVVKGVTLTIGEHRWTEDLLVDTGFYGDLRVRGDLWREMESQVDQSDPVIQGMWNPVSGVTVNKTYVQKRLVFMGCEMIDVAIGTGAFLDSTTKNSSEVPKLLIGIRGLSHMEVTGDGPGGQLFVKERSEPAISSKHNRSGVAFIPDKADEKHEAAHVLPESTAWGMGLRTGDVLVGIDDRDISDWRDEVIAPDDAGLSITERIMAGGPIRLRVRRGQEELDLELAPDKP